MQRILLLLLSFVTFVAFGQISADELYPPKFVWELWHPQKIISTGKDSWFIDFGKDAFGTLMLNIDIINSDTLVIRLGEKLASPNMIDRNPGGTIRYREIKLPVRQSVKSYQINLPPDRRNSNPPAVMLPANFDVVMPFRYCEIENYSGNIGKENILQKVLHYSFNDKASFFTSSDTTLNQIWDLCKYSIKATSFTGFFIDGDRERIPYEGDALINQLSHYCVDNEYSLARRTNEYFMQNPTWPTEWILHTVLLFYFDYMYTGDLNPIIRHYDALRAKTLISLARQDGLISTVSPPVNDELMSILGFRDTKKRVSDIVDWPPAQKDTGWILANPEGERDGYEMVPVNTVVNSFHYYNLKLMMEIAGFMGKPEDEEWFRTRASMVREAINAKLFDKNKGIYIDGEGSLHSSIHANMFPLAFGLVPDEAKTKVTGFIKSRGMACSVYGSQYLLDGLFDYGEAEYALSLLTSTTDRSWWNMIRAGSTITLEAWDLKFKPNSDWNHAWGAAPANIVTRRLWGIRPVMPGFSRAEIRPQMAGLVSSKIVVPTIKGQIIAEYEKQSGENVVYALEIPEGMTAEFVFSKDKRTEVLVNGKKLQNAVSPLILYSGKYYIEIKKQSSTR